MQPNVVLIGNQKGGVGKTTLTAQLGGICAAANWKVLLVDVDPQGNLARHLGAIERADNGRNLFEACIGDHPLRPLVDVRPNLDLVPAGERWGLAMPKLLELAGQGLGLEHAVGAIAGDYDLVLVDSPPTAGPVHDAAGLLAHYLLVVTAFDDSSLDGLRGTFRAALNLRDRPAGNPWLEILGVVMFGVPTQATNWRRRVHGELADLVGDAIPVFATTIRGIPTTAAALQRKGLLVTEGEAVAENQVTDLFRRLRAELGQADPNEVRLSTKSVGGLTDDYLRFAEEFQQRFGERQQAYAEEIA